MRITSERSLGMAKAKLPGAVSSSGLSTLAFAEQLLSAGEVLASSAAFTGGLTDLSRAGDERATLLRNGFAGGADSGVVELLSYMASLPWSQPKDLVQGVREVAMEGVISSAQEKGYLPEVEAEVFEAIDQFHKNRPLRLAVLDRAYPMAARVQLVDRAFAADHRESQVLIAAAVQRTENGVRLVSSLLRFTDQAAGRGNHEVAAVTVATPLTVEQERRLSEGLKKRYGTDVSVHVTVDPAVVGGIRVAIGNDVIDSTLASRLKSVREMIAKAPQSAPAQ